MFTGLIREVGSVARLGRSGDLHALEISCKLIGETAGIGDSVAVNGVCLTVAARRQGVLSFDVMAETVGKTTLSGLKSGDRVNLEGALKAGGAFDGHFVQGHIDCVGSVKRIISRGDAFSMEVGFPPGSGHLVVEKGSVAIDGVSLTVCEVSDGAFTVHLIPKTLDATVLKSRLPGSAVNIEFDIVGKYVSRLAKQGARDITESFLKEHGF